MSGKRKKKNNNKYKNTVRTKFVEEKIKKIALSMHVSKATV